MAFLVLILVWVAIAFVCHLLERKYISATILSFFISWGGTSILCVLEGVDPFLLVALFGTAICTMGVSLVVGIPFAIIRRRRFLESERGSTCKKCGYDLRGGVSGFCTECGKSYVGPD